MRTTSKSPKEIVWKNLIKIIALLSLLFLVIIYIVMAVAQSYLNESTHWEQNMTAVQWSSAAFGDVNNDSLPDLALSGCKQVSQTSCSGYISKIYINNGSSLVDNQSWGWNLTAVNRGSLAFGDIDNDGYLDLVLIGCNSGGGNSACTSHNAYIYINNGTSFNENRTWSYNLTGVFYGSLALGDIDNNGRLDLVLTGSSSSDKIAKIYLNSGASLIEDRTFGQNLVGVYMSSVALGDIDNNGRLDLVLSGNSGVETTKVYLNNGTSFVENPIWQQDISIVDDSSFILGDFDNDNYLDLTFIGHYTGDIHRIYRNNGTTFTLYAYESWSGGSLTGIYDGGIAWGDYNNDGNLDIAVTGHEGYTRIYWNNATSFNRVETDVISLSYGGSIVWNDVDKDGDVDLLLTGWAPSDSNKKALIYLNNRSQTQNNSLPTPPSNFSNYSLANGNIFLGWNNGSDTETTSTGLYYNLRVGTTSGGNEIMSGVFGGSSNPYGGYFGNMMQRRNISLAGSRFQVGTTYYWSVQTIDTGLAKSAWSTEQTFTLTSDFTLPVVTLNAPSGVTNQTLNIVFNASVYDDYNLTNVSLYGNWSGWHINQTNASGINNTDYIFRANLTEGEWLWGIRACDATSNCRGVNGTFRIDITYPIVALVSPANGTSQTSSNSVTFTYNVTDVAINNCTLYLNGAANETDTSITVSTSQTFAENVPNGNYNWSVKCADAANNINTSGNFSLTISYTPSETLASTSGGGGGGGGGGAVSAAVTKVTRIIASIAEGNNLIEFAESEKASVGIEEILINAEKAASNVKITIEKLTAMPASISASPLGDVYTYLQFNKTVLKDEDVKEARIKFRVDKSWIMKNSYDTNKVALNRYKTAWEALPTQYIRQNGSYYYYESTTPGFSVFAITAEKKQEEQPTTTAEKNITEEKPVIPAEEAPKAPEEPRKRLISYVFPVLIAIAIIALVIIRKSKRK